MTLRRFRWLLAAATLGVAAASLAAPPTPAMLANACAGCHGTGGASAGPTIPSLAGHPKESIVSAMKRFKSGERKGTIMNRLAKGYEEADFVAMAEFFAAQKLHSPAQDLDPARVARGRSLEKDSCSNCHKEQGRSGERGTPALAGQWLDYLKIQNEQFIDGSRGMPKKMAEKMQKLSREDLEALMHFYASVQ